MTPPLDIRAEVRAAMKRLGVTYYRLEKLSGVRRDFISRFVEGAEMKSDSLEKLLPALGLTITEDGVRRCK